MNQKEIIAILEVRVDCRERSNRGKFMGRALQKKYPYELEKVPLSRLVDILKDAISMDRRIRRIQELREDLRGTDYDEKERLEQEAQLDLEYAPGYEQDIKLHKKI